MDREQFDRTIARFDAENAEDPNLETVDGVEVPKELLYGQRMTEELTRFAPDASEALQLAARAQHLRRFDVPRDGYPDGTKGYHRWRIDLMKKQADEAAEILRDEGYDSEVADRVARLIQKKGLTTDAEAQTLEDVACLVFLRHYFAAFAAKHADDKLVGILQKTWGKMSDAGHKAAKAVPLDARAQNLLSRALSPD